MKELDIDKNSVPNHVAVIMDGNGRWAKQKGKNRIFGHRNGVKAVRETIEAAAEIGVKHVTLYAFSTENWTRPKDEINGLMELLVFTINKEIKTLMENDISLHAIGDLKSLPSACYRELMKAIDKTSSNKRMKLILALSYSSKWEIMNAVRSIAKDVEEKKISSVLLNEELFSSYLDTSPYPDPELLIRTSGEHRISNFLLWQIAYAELYFTEKLWPDFRKADFYEAIVDFQKRERRFGKTSEQLTKMLQ
ncbi:MAG TPA: isoprenyl transferase [Bacteroidia bacterium]|jgi:undecaprenyl diphosphate synthase|nr:isoprenyl transferase [Bacteroidia bacterium]